MSSLHRGHANLPCIVPIIDSDNEDDGYGDDDRFDDDDYDDGDDDDDDD